MLIVIDLQGVQTESQFRGIGRYSLSFTKALIRNNTKHEIILTLSDLLNETVDPIRAEFDGLLPKENIRIWSTPGPVRECQKGNDWRRRVAEHIREAFLASLKPDIIHICSFFEGYVDDAVTSVGIFDTSTPVGVTLYDLIPFIHTDEYLKPYPSYQQFYLRKIDYLHRASLILAISESSKREVTDYLGFNDSAVVNVSSASDECFRPLKLSKDDSRAILARYDITRPFILYTGGADERKNHPRLINAYALLPLELRKEHQLVFAGMIPEGNIKQFQNIAKKANLKPTELIITGYINDDDLVKLYNMCKLFVFPSWHEGFGLPALEAMACGAPTIGSNSTSVPEVIGWNEALFDHSSERAIKEKITQALTDEFFYKKLKDHALKQVEKFSWDQSAKKAIDAFEQIGRHLGSRNRKLPWIQHLEENESNYNKLIKNIVEISNVPTNVELISCAVSIAQNIVQDEQFFRKETLPKKIIWRIEGPFDSTYSLAIVNREIARSLEALGHKAVLHSTEGPGDFPPNEDFLRNNPDVAKMYARSKKISQKETDITSRLLYPPRVADMKSRINLLHCYAWEESGFPQDWVANFNDYLQGITCLSHHVKKNMIDNGITVPISVSGCGVDHWERIKPDRDFKIQAKSFRFLHVSSCFPRKGADILLKAFGRAFSNANDVSLVIKTFPNPHNEIRRWLDKERLEKKDYPDVVIIEDNLADDQLKSLYEQCDVLVAPSLAEGFGLPIAEAILSGLAVITTGWGGQMDFCNEETAWLIDYTFEPTRTHFDIYDSVWAFPNVEHLTSTLREVFALPESNRIRRSLKGRQLLLKEFSWADSAKRLIASACSWSQKQLTPQPLIGWVTTWNTRCGIAAYSSHLINNMSTNVQVLAARADRLTQPDGPEVVRCWNAGESDTLEDLANQIDTLGIDTLVIQFNYGFFNFDNLNSFISSEIDKGLTVVMMMHSTIDPSHAQHKKLSNLADSLNRCHRILVHTPNDLNRLKQIGLVKNSALFPQGVIDYKASCISSSSNNFTIVSYGFFLPQKGLLELIEAVGLLHNDGHKIKLKMINAEYPIQESAALIQEAKVKVENLGLVDFVEMKNDFFSDEQSLAMLEKTNLIVFPHQYSGESSSAAVRYGLAVGKPVAVTPLSIFDDVSPAIFKLPGITPKEIAKGIADLIQNLQDHTEIVQEKEREAERWRKAHYYSNLGQRLYNILVALSR